MFLFNETFLTEYVLLCHTANKIRTLKWENKEAQANISTWYLENRTLKSKSLSRAESCFWPGFIYYMSFKQLALFINSLRTENENEMSFVQFWGGDIFTTYNREYGIQARETQL